MSFPNRDVRGSLVLAGLVLTLYWPSVIAQRFFFERDIWVYWVPHIEWATRTLASGRLPHWNPFVGFGAPFLADPSFQFFYPPAILNWLLPANVAYTLLVLGHSTLGGVGMFILLRRRLHSHVAALIGATVFIAAGPLVSAANLWHHFSSAMYMPWVLDAFLRLRSGRGSALRLGFLTGLQALAGSADVCLMTGVGLVLFLPARARRLRRLVPGLGSALFLCFMIAAVQWFPAARLASKGSRSALDIRARLHWSVSPASLIDLILPLNGAAHAYLGEPEFLEERLRLVTWMYVGGSTLPLVVLGARRAPRIAVSLLLTLLASLGRFAPLAPVLTQLPVISMFRFPSKILWLFSFFWAILAAVGFRVLSRRQEGARWVSIVTGLIVLLLGLGLLLSRPFGSGDDEVFQKIIRFLPWGPLFLGGQLLTASFGRRALPAVGLLIVLDLVGAGQTFNAYSAGEIFRTKPGLVDELRSQEVGRVYVSPDAITHSPFWRIPSGWTKEEAYYFAQGQLFFPPQSVRWSIRGSFDSDFTGLARPEYSFLCATLTRGRGLNAQLLRLAGVTHVISFQAPGLADLPVVARVPTLHDRPVLLLQVARPQPFAYVVHSIRAADSTAAAIGALTDASFDSDREVIRIGFRQDVAPVEAPVVPSETNAIVESAERVVVRTKLSSPGTLVVLNALSEGWHAQVDGKPRDIVPANLLFQSVDLEAGEHKVELDYETPGLRLGATLSAMAWGWIALTLTGSRILKR